MNLAWIASRNITTIEITVLLYQEKYYDQHLISMTYCMLQLTVIVGATNRYKEGERAGK